MEKRNGNNREKTMRISDVGIMELSGMEFHAYHGCLESEKKNGNTFVVDFKAEYFLKKAATSDKLEDAADYGKIFKIVEQQMNIPRNLLETVAANIVTEIRNEFPNYFQRIKVTVSKKNPPVEGNCAWSRVTACWNHPAFIFRANEIPII